MSDWGVQICDVAREVLAGTFGLAFNRCNLYKSSDLDCQGRGCFGLLQRVQKSIITIIFIILIVFVIIIGIITIFVDDNGSDNDGDTDDNDNGDDYDDGPRLSP